MTGQALAQRAAEQWTSLSAGAMDFPGRPAMLTARFQPKLCKPGVGNSLQQILAALGAGTGQGGRDGYGLFQ